jgi:hypothetical protein
LNKYVEKLTRIRGQRVLSLMARYYAITGLISLLKSCKLCQKLVTGTIRVAPQAQSAIADDMLR